MRYGEYRTLFRFIFFIALPFFMPIFTFSLGNITLSPTWYGLMYVLGFIVCYLFLLRVIQWKNTSDIDTLVLFLFFGVLLGGRIGYVLFYNFSYFWSHPLEILMFWKGGMSFHGGFLGVVLALWCFSKTMSYSFWYVIDRLAVIVPLAFCAGRLGNWINNELPGYTPYTGIAPMYVNGRAHFPSPLLEMFLEGILLFCCMYFFFSRTSFQNTRAKLSGVFLIGYGLARMAAECFRLPDAHIGYLFDTQYITLGMCYTFPMILMGIGILFFSQKSPLSKNSLNSI